MNGPDTDRFDTIADALLDDRVGGAIVPVTALLALEWAGGGRILSPLEAPTDKAA